MSAADILERNLELVYDAALDDDRWPAASALVEEAVGTDRHAIVVGEWMGEDHRVHFVRCLRQGNSLLAPMRAYLEDLHLEDPLAPRIKQLPHGKLARIADLYSEDERKTSPAYNEGLRKLGACNGLVARFDGPGGLDIVCAAGDPVAGEWQPAQLRLVKRLLPHLHRAILIRQSLAANQGLGTEPDDLVHGDRIGVLRLDRDGRVLEANATALDILRRGDGLLDRDGVLDASHPADRDHLRQILQRALPDLWGEPATCGSTTVERPSGRSRLAVHVTPVGAGAADFGARRTAAFVLAVNPENRLQVDAERVALALGLTASEGRAAALLAEGRKVNEIAAATGWQENYVRWLLQRVRAKLRVSGQVAVVRRVLVADLLPPS